MSIAVGSGGQWWAAGHADTETENYKSYNRAAGILLVKPGNKLSTEV